MAPRNRKLQAWQCTSQKKREKTAANVDGWDNPSRTTIKPDVTFQLLSTYYKHQYYVVI